MTTDFDQTRAAFGSSVAGRALAWTAEHVDAAWRTSWLRTTTTRMTDRWRQTPATLIRAIAIAVAIASAMQPLLMWLMPATVKPAMPVAVFVIVTILAAALAFLTPDRPAANIR